jgi:hypothetical protein
MFAAFIEDIEATAVGSLAIHPLAGMAAIGNL